jgi:hypothetical protein
VKPYKELLGSLLYAALITRPDICTAVNFYGRIQNNATEIQWQGLKISERGDSCGLTVSK